MNNPYLVSRAHYTQLRNQSKFPLLYDVKHNSLQGLKRDFLAGLTVAVLLVPQGMAYASLAGLPPIYGLYGGLVPLIIYALLGTSKHLAIGPVAVSAILVLSGVSKLATPLSASYIELVILTGFLVGICQFILSVLRLGFLANFLSHPVIAGFTSAASLIIIFTQLDEYLGIQISSAGFFENIVSLTKSIETTHMLTLAISSISTVLLLTLRKVSRSIPSALIIVVLSTLISWYFGFELRGVSIIGQIPSGLPSFAMPNFDPELIFALGPTVLAVTVIGLVESIAIARALEAKHKGYTISPNQEFLALGLSKVFGSFFQSLPTSGSFSRSAINSASGAQSGMAGIFTAIIVCITLLFFTPLLYHLPAACLAVIIIVAVLGLFDKKEFVHLWNTHRPDFYMMLATFVITLGLGIEAGVLSGVILSIVNVLYRSSKPNFATLGRIAGTDEYRDLSRFEYAVAEDDAIILRFDAQLYFANASYFKESILDTVSTHPNIRHIVLDGSNMSDIDSSGVTALKDVDIWLKERNIDLHLCSARGAVRDMLFKSGLLSEVDKHHISVHECIKSIHLDDYEYTSVATQTILK